MAKGRARVIGAGIVDRERAFDVDFNGLNDPYELEVASLPYMGLVNIAIHVGQNACAFIAPVGRHDGSVVLGNPGIFANCLPAVTADKSGFYVTFQQPEHWAFNLVFSLDGRTITVTQVSGPVTETVTFHLA